MTIHVVTSGEYSDYHIEAMFSTKELAEKYIDGQIDHDPKAWVKARDFSIEEWALDEEHQPKQWGTEYRVNIWLKDGCVADNPSESRHEIKANTRGYYYAYGEADAVVKQFSFGNRATYTEPPGKSLGVSYKSHEHATKLAIEGRQAWLRSEQTQEKMYSEEVK